MQHDKDSTNSKPLVFLGMSAMTLSLVAAGTALAVGTAIHRQRAKTEKAK